MKHNFLSQSVLILGLSILLPAAVFAQQQSLGDAARQARKNKQPDPARKVITNDDIATTKPASDTSSASQPATPAADASKEKSADDKAKLSDDDQAKLDKEWQVKIGAQKDQIALLERELDVLQREDKLRATNYYADAGNRLRDPKKYAEDDRKYQDDIAAKQKAIEDAKTKLEQMKEDARKAGASASAIG